MSHFSHRDLTFAIELKGKGVEEDAARLLRKYDMAKKTVVTSFQLDYLRNFQAAAPEFATGYLTQDTRQETLEMLRQMGVTEYCPEAASMTPELTQKCHEMGLRVRAWGVYDEKWMEHAIRCGAEGMTVNFPDKLTAYLQM